MHKKLFISEATISQLSLFCIVLSTQQIRPWEHCALYRGQYEHPATLHSTGAHDWRGHEELLEAEQATSCMSVTHVHVCTQDFESHWHCPISRIRLLLCQWGSCCRWPGTSLLAVATWRRTTSYTGSHPQLVEMMKMIILCYLGDSLVYCYHKAALCDRLLFFSEILLLEIACSPVLDQRGLPKLVTLAWHETFTGLWNQQVADTYTVFQTMVAVGVQTDKWLPGLFVFVIIEPAITGKVAVQCCQSNGCHQKLSWRGSSLARLTPGMISNHIRGKGMCFKALSTISLAKGSSSTKTEHLLGQIIWVASWDLIIYSLTREMQRFHLLGCSCRESQQNRQSSACWCRKRADFVEPLLPLQVIWSTAVGDLLSGLYALSL